MMRAAIALAMLAPWTAGAQEFSVRGVATARVVAPSDEVSWNDGGFGRLRYGADDASPGVYLSDVFLEPELRFGSAVTVSASLKRDPEQDAPVDILEGEVRFRPATHHALQPSVRIGAFFPPISFENDDIGWTSRYTATTSAINSWVGEEIRAIGVEGALAHRSERRTLTAHAAAFGWNDPMGVLIAVRGWGLTDRTTGLLDDIRLHDAFAALSGHAPPYSEEIIREIDDRPGYYVGGAWEERDRFSLRLLRYDNRADPAAVRNGQQAWRTRFWSAGAMTEWGAWTVIAQGMTGETVIDKAAGLLATDFASAFLLVSRDLGDVRLSARGEFFRTDESRNAVLQSRKEDGGALTLAARWFVAEHAEAVAELVQVSSDRPERLAAGLPQAADETQLQILVRGRF